MEDNFERGMALDRRNNLLMFLPSSAQLNPTSTQLLFPPPSPRESIEKAISIQLLAKLQM